MSNGLGTYHAGLLTRASQKALSKMSLHDKYFISVGKKREHASKFWHWGKKEGETPNRNWIDLSEVSYLEGKELHQANSHLSKQDKFSLSFKDDM